MTEYTEQARLVDSMRACRDGSCKGCMLENYRFAEPRIACPDMLLSKGADMIERLYAKTQKPQHELDEMIVEYEAEIRDLNRGIEDLEAQVEELREELGLT